MKKLSVTVIGTSVHICECTKHEGSDVLYERYVKACQKLPYDLSFALWIVYFTVILAM
jgi:hypothetical protein